MFVWCHLISSSIPLNVQCRDFPLLLVTFYSLNLDLTLRLVFNYSTSLDRKMN